MDAFFKSVMNWNKLKSNEVEMAFKKMLFPQLRKEMIHKIRGERIKRSILRILRGVLFDIQEVLKEKSKTSSPTLLKPTSWITV